MKTYASLQDRLSTHLGDIVIVNSIALAISIVIVALTKLSESTLIDNADYGYGTLVFIVWCLYSTLMNSQYFEGTFGKRMMKMKVLHTSRRGLSLMEAFFRFIFGFLLFGVLFGMLPIAFTPKKQGLHDLLLSTVVLKKH